MARLAILVQLEDLGDFGDTRDGDGKRLQDCEERGRADIEEKDGS